jgi:SulP family sulfate permease
MKKRGLPKLFEALPGYNLRTFATDLVAGLTVGLVALPLAMAFAISSGVPPQAGLYTAIVAGFLISALGGSKTQIGGPTGAFVVIVFGIVAQHGVNGLLVCTVMAGFMLLFLGLTGLGAAVRFIPRPVVVGFTNGIAVLIASTQVKDFFGLQIDKVPGDFPGRVNALVTHAYTLSPTTTVLAAGALLVVILFRSFVPKVPGAIVALLLGTTVVAATGLPVETIGTRFGGIPAGLPSFTLPEFQFDMIPALISPAVTVALLGAIESLMSAVVADRMSGDTHYPNVELVAQGIANIVAPFFGGIPATGAIARTATNIRSGARTPVAGMVHALTLLAVLLVAAPLAYHIPLAVLSAILMVVAYNMGEWREIPKLLKMSWSTVAVWFATFALTVFADLTVAVQVGMILAALLFIRKVARTTTVARVTKEYVEDGRLHILQDKHIPDYVTVVRIHGPFLFGAAEKLSAITDHMEDLPPVVILRLRNMTAIDATGLLALEDLADKLHAAGRALILCGARPQPAKLMRQAEFERHVGAANVCPHIDAALKRARAVYEKSADADSDKHRQRGGSGVRKKPPSGASRLPAVGALLAVGGAACWCASYGGEAAVPSGPTDAVAPSPGSSEAALDELRNGNLRFRNSRRTLSTDTRGDAERRHRTAKGQHPFATILCCSDSRVSPEFVFDQRPGSLFEVRNAGNVVDDDVMASLEYAVGHLHIPLIVVLGHKGCGAIEAVCEAGDAPLPDHLRALQTQFKGIHEQVVECNHRHDAEVVDRLAKENARQQALTLLREDAVLKAAVDAGSARLVYALYDMETGAVEFFDFAGNP